MKTVFGFFFVGAFFLTAHAQTLETPKSILCWGVNASGVSIQFTFDPDKKFLTHSEEVRTGGEMPPYPYAEVGQWKLQSVVVDRTKLEASGRTVGTTSGMAGRIMLIGTKSGDSSDYGLDRVFYSATAEVLPAVSRVVPRVATPYDLNCETRW